MGFFGPPPGKTQIAGTNSGEFLGPKLSTPTILPISAFWGFWGGPFFGCFWGLVSSRSYIIGVNRL
jgi:hypothetical protein